MEMCRIVNASVRTAASKFTPRVECMGIEPCLIISTHLSIAEITFLLLVMGISVFRVVCPA
jgi:hypothetical protein